MTTGTLSTKGWVIIPFELRKRYGLKKGDKLHFVDYGGVIFFPPASKDLIRAVEGKQDEAKGKTVTGSRRVGAVPILSGRNPPLPLKPNIPICRDSLYPPHTCSAIMQKL